MAGITPSGDGLEPIFVSVNKAAQLLSLTPWSVYKLLDEQAIESQYQGRRRLVRYSSLVEYANGLPTTPADPEAVS